VGSAATLNPDASPFSVTLHLKMTSRPSTLVVDGAGYTRSGSTGTIANSAPVSVGAKDGSGADQYTGLLDEVSLTKG
jgi:hypothetical protein